MSKGFLIKPKTNTETKLTIVLRCWGFDQKNTETSSGRFRWCINSQATCLPVSAIPARHGRAIDLEKPVQSKQQAFNYVYHKGCVFPPIQIKGAKFYPQNKIFYTNNIRVSMTNSMSRLLPIWLPIQFNNSTCSGTAVNGLPWGVNPVGSVPCAMKKLRLPTIWCVIWHTYKFKIIHKKTS